MSYRLSAVVVAALALLVLVFLSDGAAPFAQASASGGADTLGVVLTGDADCDGTVDIADALELLIADVGLSDAGCLDTNGDLDCDATGTSADALPLLRFLAQLDAQLAGCGLPPPSTFDLIDEALAGGTIDDETALIYKVYATFGDTRLPPQFVGDDSLELDSMVMGEVADRIATLSPGAQAILNPFLIPPIYPESWFAQNNPTSADAQPAEMPCPGCPDVPWASRSYAFNSHVKVWWQVARPNDEAIANQLVTEIEGTIWPKLTTLMGRLPIPDGNLQFNGGDDRLDIYLQPFTGSTLGVTVAYPPGCEHRPTYIGIDPGSVRPKVVAAHELMHAIQFSIDLAEGCNEYEWLGEATASWAIDYVYPSDNYEHRWAPTYLDRTKFKIEMWDYEAYPLFFYLARKGDPSVISSIWDKTEQFDSLQAIDEGIPNGLREAWPDFADYNWNREKMDKYRVWDQLNASAKETKRNLSLNGAMDELLQIDPLKNEGLEHLSSTYYHYVFTDDNIRTVWFYNGWDYDLQRVDEGDLGTHLVPMDWGSPDKEDAHVHALIKVNGQWQDPEDWSGLDKRPFCRDKVAERIEELVLVFSNSQYEYRDKILKAPGEPPTLLLSNMGCFEWAGTADFRNVDDGVTETIHSNVRWSVEPPFQGTYFSPFGSADWKISGTDSSGCIYSGEETVILDTLFSPLQALVTFNDYIAGQAARAYSGLGDSQETVTVTTNCPSDHGPVISHDTRPLGFWLQAESSPLLKVKDDGTTIDDEFVAGSARWNWRFLAQRE